MRKNEMVSTTTKAHESKVYHDLANWYERVFERFFGPRIQATLRALEIPPGSRILEVGVGTGISLSAYPQHAQVTAIDLSAEMLQQAQRKVDHHGWTHINLREMDALNLEYPDEYFDFVTTFHVVTVVPDYQRLMKEMLRVCRTHGTLVIINHFRSPRPWIAVSMDLLDPLTHRMGWRTTLRVRELLNGLPIEVQRDYKTSWRSLFRVIIARKVQGVA